MEYRFLEGNVKRFAIKAVLIALAILCPLKARASEQTWVSIDSVTWSDVSISSLTPVRVDNLILGTTGQALVGRTQIVLTIPSGAAKFNCNYYVGTATSSTQVTISTASGNTYLGAEFATTSTQSLQVTVPCPTTMSYWCQGQGATNPTIHVDQTRPLRALFGN